VENPGTLLVSASLLELQVEHLEVVQEEDEVETVVADHPDLAITAARLDTSLVTALRRDLPQTPVHATTATRQVICPGTAQQVEVEVAVVKNLANATNVARKATCPVTAQTLLHLHNRPNDAASATHVASRITLLATVHRRATAAAQAT